MPEFLQPITDILHDLPGFLDEFVRNNGVWVYVLLFAIIFAETGLVVLPFLPGDSLLFAAGAVAARGSMNPWVLAIVLIAAAVLGDAVNYHLGKWIGPRVFNRGGTGKNQPSTSGQDARHEQGSATNAPRPASASLGHLPRDTGEGSEGALSDAGEAGAMTASGEASGATAGATSGFQRIVEKALNRKHLDRAHAFFEKYGGKAVVLARFVPIVRTFIPFVAGAGAMHYAKFAFFNVLGAVLWVGICVGAGWFFGNIPLVKDNFEAVIVAIVAVSLIPLAVEFILARRRASLGATAEGAA